MAGCGYVFFQRANCSLLITNSNFERNTAKNGGAFYLDNTLGMIVFINNTFTENSAENDGITSGGGVFCLKASAESFFNLNNNSFVSNSAASKGGVYIAISGNIQEFNSHYFSKFIEIIYDFLI